jgi:hypothetical protein
VETDQWKRVFNGEVDVVFGAKGSGKTAIYSLVGQKADDLRNRHIEVALAERASSDAIFASVGTVTTEEEFRSLWKLYFLKRVTQHLRAVGLEAPKFRRVERVLEKAGLVEYKRPLFRRIARILGTVKSWLNPEALEGGIKINPQTGAIEGLTVKMILREPSTAERSRGIVSLDGVVGDLDLSLASAGRSVWVMIDRLDAQFSPVELEIKALRGLFRTYIDFIPLKNIDLKIFVRTDIWKSLTVERFSEASHIVRHTTVEWDLPSLLNLIARRAIHNQALCEYYGVNASEVLASTEALTLLFYRLFPLQADPSSQMATLDWLLSRVSDGTGRAAPREVIHALSAARQAQLKMHEVGAATTDGSVLFDERALMEAVTAVSREHYEQTLLAEFPRFQSYLQSLDGGSAGYTSGQLASVWNCDVQEVSRIAEELVEIGFFNKRRLPTEPFLVSNVYRDALHVSG